jgi:hypothetical protein
LCGLHGVEEHQLTRLHPDRSGDVKGAAGVLYDERIMVQWGELLGRGRCRRRLRQ